MRHRKKKGKVVRAWAIWCDGEERLMKEFLEFKKKNMPIIASSTCCRVVQVEIRVVGK